MKPLRLLTVSLALSLGLLPTARAQQAPPQPVKYWIFLGDKIDDAGKAALPEPGYLSVRALERRLRRGAAPRPALDAPVSSVHLRELGRLGVIPLVRSRWLNAVSAVLGAEDVDVVRRLPFVRDVRPVGRALPPPEPEALPAPGSEPAAGKTTMMDYGPSLSQLEKINTVAALERGINGTGVRFGFLDTEFGDFQHAAFARLVEEGRLIATANFTGESQSNLHGRSVASVAVGFDEGHLIGPAYGAEVLAATTEYAPTETNQEEDNLVAGLEWMEAQGVDVVNISLGYTTFDPGQHSYTPADLDGKTAVTTRAADLAAGLGVVVVTSAGNDGCAAPDQCWYYIGTPADGDSVITVGAVNLDGSLASFSSRGPTADGRIKPDVSALGTSVLVVGSNGTYGRGSGTSFASPLVAAVACQILQVNPNLTPIEVRDILRATAGQADAPDNERGWGIIDAEAAILAAQQRITATEDEGQAPDGFLIAPPYPNPFSDRTVIEVRAPAGAGFAALSVYDLLGRRVAVPFEGTLLPGVNRIVFRAEALPPGLYLYTLKGERVSRSGSLVLAR